MLCVVFWHALVRKGSLNKAYFSGNHPRNNYNNGNQRYSHRQTYGHHTNANASMYTMPPQYMLQPSPNDGMQSIINNKFFQSSRLPNTVNPCAYQSMGQGQSFNQYSAPVPYTYQYTQPPAAAVQQ